MLRPSIRIRRRPTGIARIRGLMPSGARLKDAGSTVVATTKSVADRLPDLPGRKPQPRFSRRTKALGALGLAAMVIGLVASYRSARAAFSPTRVGGDTIGDKPSATEAAAATLGHDPALAEARDDDDALRATAQSGASGDAITAETDAASTDGDAKS